MCFGGAARVAEAKAAWGRAQAEARRAQAEAVEDLVGSGLQVGEVAELLGISNRELRNLGAATPARPKRTRPFDDRDGGVPTTSPVSSPTKLGENGTLRQAERPFVEEPSGPGGSICRLQLQYPYGDMKRIMFVTDARPRKSHNDAEYACPVS